MSGVVVNLLVERLAALISSAAADQRYPSLELLLRRGRPVNITPDFPADSVDEVRCRLFVGLAHSAPVPVAALTRLAGGHPPGKRDYCLKVDPVLLRADMARVLMIGHGFADLDAAEIEQIQQAVQTVLQEAGMKLDADPVYGWSLVLEQPPDVAFTPLENALGMDLAEALPDNRGARPWRHLLNEIQMALHACPCNEQRRKRGFPEINSVWFWGGGCLPPAAATQAYSRVYSDHPVSRGLGELNGCEVLPLSAADDILKTEPMEPALVDFCPPPAPAAETLAHLESLLQGLVEQVRRKATVLSLYSAEGQGWQLDRGTLRQFWKRPVPLKLSNVHS